MGLDGLRAAGASLIGGLGIAGPQILFLGLVGARNCSAGLQVYQHFTWEIGALLEIGQPCYARPALLEIGGPHASDPMRSLIHGRVWTHGIQEGFGARQFNEHQLDQYDPQPISGIIWDAKWR